MPLNQKLILSYKMKIGETLEAVATTEQKNLQKPVPRAAAAYGRQLKSSIIDRYVTYVSLE